MGKTVGMVAQGACRSLVIYRCELGDQGVYVCDAHDAQSSASLKVQGGPMRVRTSCPPPHSPVGGSAPWLTLPCPLQQSGQEGGRGSSAFPGVTRPCLLPQVARSRS